MPKLMPLLLLGKHSSGCVRVSSALLTLSWAVPLVPPTQARAGRAGRLG